MVTFTVANDLFLEFPTLKIGVIVINNFDNQQKGTIVKLRTQEKIVKRELQNKDLSELETIKVWRQAYSYFGAKP
ncbi:MAG TPA: hypothetical protein VJI98_03645, partial [Candidatus Nanoarchaeia archaeon]|nr:hypothetical protein [Candidatus Nanoarchaeia archaeon]